MRILSVFHNNKRHDFELKKFSEENITRDENGRFASSGSSESSESSEEKSNIPETARRMADAVQVAHTITRQLGSGRFVAMTGAKDFVVTEKGVKFSIPKAKSSINRVSIDLMPSDTYDMKFHSAIGSKVKLVSEATDIYADGLQETFTRHTGLDTHL